ncbi:MAG: insulinase family protein, partial [Planctomycetes bacterium]|nr:insulinase family protein [Planctomycetota bacterium]
MRLHLSLACLVLCPLLGTAEAVPGADAVGFPHEHSDLRPDPAVRWGRLGNGLRYCLMRNQQPREKVSLRLQVESGSLLESEAQRGLAHYLEHLAFNGTTNFPPGQLTRRLQPAGIAFGAHSNAHTSFDETVYKLDLPDPSAATVDLGLTVITDFAGGMLIGADEVAKERGVILAEMRDRNTPAYRQRLAEFAVMFPGLRLGERFPIGIPETIAAASPELIRAYYDAWYRPERMILAVVGAIDLDVMAQAVESRLGPLRSRAT